MEASVNQAVVFTKPVYHLDIPLAPEQLDERLRGFLEEKGFRVVKSRKVTGDELARRNTIRDHYAMYSRGSCIDSAAELDLLPETPARFAEAFGRDWQTEVEAGRIVGNPQLMREKGIDAATLAAYWEACSETAKLQAGLVMGWIPELETFGINGFYPELEEIFNNPATEIFYHVVESDPQKTSWKHFRRDILGATNAAKASPDSLRGQLYAAFRDGVPHPGRDNFAHGSAGPFEGLVERIVHEPDFTMEESPVGRYLLERGVDLESFKDWKARQPVYRLGEVFDATEELDTADALARLNAVEF